MKTILLTGFEPFAGETLNASWEVARRLHGTLAEDGSRVIAMQLPCVFERALRVLEERLDSLRPQTAVALGQAGGSPCVRLERVAINLDDACMVDNAGQQPVDVPVVHGGPTGYFSGLPIKAMASALRKVHIPVSVSHSAGTYVCNHVFYGLMHEAGRRESLKRAGFIHLPYLPEQVMRYLKAPAMSLETQLSAMRLALRVVQTIHKDEIFSEGTLD
ncbi:pyroglutamyl-peptidase I [Rhodanobacter sp. Si-c]|uniref:Pyroglutamyl-peptidase I n=1 Tax=Rhodanobacter lycopersici TaxID=3162487 RepID=A0ABV3Q902_9GAMM